MFNHTKGVYGYSSFCQISLLALEDGQEMALLLDAVLVYNPPNHLLVEPWYYHSDGSKITLLPWPW